MDSIKDLTKFEQQLKIKFRNKKKLITALTHKSYTSEQLLDINESNERLEFLGDSVLSAIVSTDLFENNPEDSEGDLSQVKSILVSRNTLYNWAKDYNLGKYLILSYSEDLTGGRERESILANAMEALLGAIYLEKGFDTAKKFIYKKLADKRRVIIRDYKSKLQEECQKMYKTIPTYIVTKESGPDHDKIFTIIVKINNKTLGQGSGKNKKEAEQSAAKEALRQLNINCR